MLRITVLDGGGKQTLKVEGKLAGPWVSELELAWNQVRQRGPGRQIVVDLSDMTSIDPRGKSALIAMIADGARLTAKGLYCEYVVSELTKRARKVCARADARHKAAGTSDSTSAKQSG